MRNLILFLLLFCSITAKSTNYYVDSSVTDTNVSSATPDFTTYNPVTFQTTGGTASVYNSIADVNAATFASGDFVYFRRGQSWYGQLVCDSGTTNGTTGVYCMGDSQTSGDYPVNLTTSLGSGYLIHDVGVGGENTAQMLARFATDVTSQADDNYVIIMGGTNDVFQAVAEATVESNLAAMYAAAKAQGSIVIAMTITPSNAIVSSPSALARRDNINTWIRNKPTNVDYVIDTYEALEDPANPNYILPAYTTDGTHYTEAANVVILSAIHRVVTFFRKTNPNVVTYSAFGTGANPILNYALDCSFSGNWTQESTNKWKYFSTQAYDAGNVIYNNSTLCGVKKWNKYALQTQGDYYWDKATNYLYIYSTSNPGTYYSKIESLMNRTIVEFSNKNYITFENLTVTKGGRLGFNGTASTNITIRNCDISWIGAGCQLASDSIRVGNAIQFYSAASDILVENCRIWEIYDTGITNQSYDDATVFRNIVYRNNLIWNCEYSIEIYSRETNSTVANTVVENNTCVNAGSSWAHNQRPVKNGYHLRLALTPVATTNFIIKNNIFDTSTEHIIGIIYNDAARYWSDYNICYQPSGNFGFRYGTSFATIEAFRAATGFEVHSVNQNPLFHYKVGLDFRIEPSSPAINFGYPSGDAGKLNWRYTVGEKSIYRIGDKIMRTGNTIYRN